MPLPKDKAWFAAKTYGWGWGLPLRWQGWVAMAVFIGVTAAGSLLLAKSGPVDYAIFVTVAVSIFGGICYWKGEKPGWRWGSRE